MGNRLLPLLAALSLSACDLLGNSDKLDFQLIMREVEAHDPDGPTIRARVEHGRIIVTGGITTHCVDNEPTGNVVMPNRSRIDVIVTEQQFEPTCEPQDRFFEYDVVIAAVDARRYLISVIHRPIGAQQVTVYSEHIDLN